MSAEDADIPKLESVRSGESVKLPSALFRGKLKINGLAYECQVLNDFRRVFSEREVIRLLTAGLATEGLFSLLDANPLIDLELVRKASFPFLVTGIKPYATGYDVLVVIEILDRYIEAWNRDLLNKDCERFVEQAMLVMRACAVSGIVAMIDEATSFQAHRTSHTLYVKMEALKMLTIAKS